MAHSDPALAVETPLLPAEIDQGEALVREAGWNQTAADWRTFLDLGTAYAVRNSAGRVVATAATLPYGGRFAWISMVLVTTQYRRGGLATRLLRRCIDDITAAGLVAVLDATPAGRAVYLGLGFQDSWGFARLQSRAHRPEAVPPKSGGDGSGGTVRPIAAADWQKLCAYDTAAFGADRSGVLARLRGRLPAAELVAERGGRIAGFLLGRDGNTAAQLGPLIAEDEEVARVLLARALGALTGPVFMDLADAKAAVGAWLATCGFTVQRPFTRMLLGRSAGFDDPTRTFAVVGPEFG
jgi:N-acetylglutamate synthase-like GNAT family acetyltransferase